LPQAQHKATSPTRKPLWASILNIADMKIRKFYSLRGSIGDHGFHRTNGKHKKAGVYFWGFNLREDNQYPEKAEDILIWYIGKDKNVSQRIMQELTQLIFGGFGTIIDFNYLKQHPFDSLLMELQESDSKRTKPLHPAVLYKSDGLHVLYHFLNDIKIQETLKWMKERLLFTWIEEADGNKREIIEAEMHRIVGNNIFGGGDIKNRTKTLSISHIEDTPNFHQVKWEENEVLMTWLTKVNEKIIYKASP
jgi:hypothetical protein